MLVIATYLSSEGFAEARKGKFYSRELNATIESTINPTLWNITTNGFTFRDINADDISIAVEAMHALEGTTLVVELYNMQHGVLTKKLKPIKEDV